MITERDNEITVIKGITEHFATPTSTDPEWIEYHEYHIPFFGILFLTIIFLYVINIIFKRLFKI